MEASNYYDNKALGNRSLNQGNGVRNTHNFIKALLIQNHVPKRASVLDLGCGQGGDLAKISRCDPIQYTGIDASSTAIRGALCRMLRSPLLCTSKLMVSNMADEASPWPEEMFDVVNCQFALHHAFRSAETATTLLFRLRRCLNSRGCVFGTVPVHDCAYKQVKVTLPGDTRPCMEPSLTRDELENVAGKCGLQLTSWESFDAFYDRAKITHADLLNRMNASHRPAPGYATFTLHHFLTDKEILRAMTDCNYTMLFQSIRSGRLSTKRLSSIYNESGFQNTVLNNLVRYGTHPAFNFST